MEKVLVLISTYNGELYLREQLDCILAQTRVAVNLLIRDDGSTDNTREILDEYSKKYANIKVYFGSNKGFTFSFYDLIENAHGYDYYALSDQDDIWKEDKLYNAIMRMDKNYIMYASNLDIVDEKLNFIRMLYNNTDYEKKILDICFPFYNPFGCSMVWKNSLQEKIRGNLPDIRIPHDLWMHVSANFNGSVYIDENSFILHRIHGKNACGIGKSTFTRIKKLKKFYLSDFRTTTDTTLKIAQEKYGLKSFTVREREFIKLLVNYKGSYIKKIELYRSCEFKYISKRKRLEFLFLILVNKF